MRVQDNTPVELVCKKNTLLPFLGLNTDYGNNVASLLVWFYDDTNGFGMLTRNPYTYQ